MSTKVSKYLPWIIWLVATSFFFFSYVIRVSPSILVEYLMQDLHTTAGIVGVLSSCFYYPYVIMQIPVGVILDKLKAQQVLWIMAATAGIGSLLFAVAGSLMVACIARAIIGFACAFAFIGAIKLASSWHPSGRMGLIVGLTQASGMLGALLILPMAKALGHVNWRVTIVAIAIIFLLIAIIIKIFAKTGPISINQEDKSLKIYQAIKQVLTSTNTWLNAVFIGLFFIPTTVFGELWGTTFISHTYGISTANAAYLNGLIFLGWIVGAPILGSISDIIGRRKVVMLPACMLLLVLTYILIYWSVNIYALGFLLFGIGLTSSGAALSYALATEINDKAVTATALSFTNMASVIAGTIFMPIVGMRLDNVDKLDYINSMPVYTQEALQYAFFPIIICLCLAILVGSMINEPNTNIGIKRT